MEKLAVARGSLTFGIVILRIPIACIAALAVAAARGETWHTASGTTEQGTLSGVYGPVAAIVHDDATLLIPLVSFNDDELGRVADFVLRHPVNATPWKSSKSPLAKALLRRLNVLRDGKLVPFDPGTRAEPEFYVIYFGAGWCPPCREFSRRFVPTYRRLKQFAAGRFEVIFMSSDRSASDMVNYMNEARMPWPALTFDDRGYVSIVERWEAHSIPCIAVVMRDGTIVYHSHHGSEYLGPDKPIEQLESLLIATMPKNPAVHRSLHRLAVLEQVRRARRRSLAPVPYDVHLDLSRYQTLETNSLTATLSIDEKGHVTDAEFKPDQSAAIDFSLFEDAENWLFLPAIRDGRPVATKVVMPLELRR